MVVEMWRWCRCYSSLISVPLQVTDDATLYHVFLLFLHNPHWGIRYGGLGYQVWRVGVSGMEGWGIRYGGLGYQVWRVGVSGMEGWGLLGYQVWRVGPFVECVCVV